MSFFGEDQIECWAQRQHRHSLPDDHGIFLRTARSWLWSIRTRCMASSRIDITLLEDVPAQDENDRLVSLAEATTQVYEHAVKELSTYVSTCTADIDYWQNTLSSPWRLGLVSVQTAPLRIWSNIISVRREARNAPSTENLWSVFYRRCVSASVALPLPVIMENKQKLHEFRERAAAGLGILVDQGLRIDSSPDRKILGSCLSRTIDLLDTILRNLDDETRNWESLVRTHASDNLAEQTQRLQALVGELLKLDERTKEMMSRYRKPGLLLKYWLPGLFLLLSSSTMLRVLTRRRAELQQWVTELVETSADFWSNWIVDPLKQVIATIRHDADSEITLMTKESLQGDRASLERMVVDFARDNASSALSDAEIATIKDSVQSGDLTPVLTAYERDLRRPIQGAIRGDLVRTMLIQVQKTKVDIDVALGGIDGLLKSQELVFGLVGLTPGILITAMLTRWLSSIVGGRRGRRLHHQKDNLLRPLCRIDRILSRSGSESSKLSYSEYGRLLCEAQVLRRHGEQLLRGAVRNDFDEEVRDLADRQTGIPAQLRAVDRIRWAFARQLVDG